MLFVKILIYISTIIGVYASLFFLLTFFTGKDRKVTWKTWPKVTIAVPFYNEDPDVLRKTVDSLLALDYPKDKLEIMLINDGSTNKTPKVAEAYQKKGIIYISKENGGKGSCLNLAIDRATGEFFGCLDVDSIVAPDALKKIMPYFRKNVMSVTPALKVMKPESILERVQMVEFMLGVYFRKVFAKLDAIHVTPGPFSIFRISFFKKYGKYDENTLTEDIEVALRIQKLGFEIENCMDANVYTYGVGEFKALQRQRLRWYRGFIDNVMRYSCLFSPKKKHLGLFILPLSFFSMFLLIAICVASIVQTIVDFVRFTKNLAAVNWDLSSLFLWKFDAFFIDLNTLVILSLLSLFFGLFSLYISKKYSRETQKMVYSVLWFFAIYTFLFAWWWSLAAYYKVTNKKILWAGRAL